MIFFFLFDFDRGACVGTDAASRFKGAFDAMPCTRRSQTTERRVRGRNRCVVAPCRPQRECGLRQSLVPPATGDRVQPFGARFFFLFGRELEVGR